MYEPQNINRKIGKLYLSGLFLSIILLKGIAEILSESKVKEEDKTPQKKSALPRRKNPCTKKPLKFIFSEKTLEFFTTVPWFPL